MSSHELIRAPSLGAEESIRYAISARAKRTFHTVLDASDMLLPGNASRAQITTRKTSLDGADAVEVVTEFGMRKGQFHESLTLRPQNGSLVAARLFRTLDDNDNARRREERAVFGDGPIVLPPDAYPEIALPFLLRWQPIDKTRRSLHAWICDRFVAKVYYELARAHTLDVPAGRFDAHEVVMYPDLNDWVRLPSMLASLSKPFLPKYHMHYETRAPHRLVRFEGPFGPPGAPEIVLEML